MSDEIIYHFEWDPAKDLQNHRKHGVPFSIAQHAFADRKRVIAQDLSHSTAERRYYSSAALAAQY